MDLYVGSDIVEKDSPPTSFVLSPGPASLSLQQLTAGSAAYLHGTGGGADGGGGGRGGDRQRPPDLISRKYTSEWG